jgi:hypothetical protein
MDGSWVNIALFPLGSCSPTHSHSSTLLWVGCGKYQ